MASNTKSPQFVRSLILPLHHIVGIAPACETGVVKVSRELAVVGLTPVLQGSIEHKSVARTRPHLNNAQE